MVWFGKCFEMITSKEKLAMLFMGFHEVNYVAVPLIGYLQLAEGAPEEFVQQAKAIRARLAAIPTAIEKASMEAGDQVTEDLYQGLLAELKQVVRELRMLANAVAQTKPLSQDRYIEEALDRVNEVLQDSLFAE
jgi:hypothetical protein